MKRGSITGLIAGICIILIGISVYQLYPDTSALEQKALNTRHVLPYGLLYYSYSFVGRAGTLILSILAGSFFVFLSLKEFMDNRNNCK